MRGGEGGEWAGSGVHGSLTGQAWLCLDFPLGRVGAHLVGLLRLSGEPNEPMFGEGMGVATPKAAYARAAGLPARGQLIWGPQREAEPRVRGERQWAALGPLLHCPSQTFLHSNQGRGVGGLSMSPTQPWSGGWGWESLKIPPHSSAPTAHRLCAPAQGTPIPSASPLTQEADSDPPHPPPPIRHLIET